MDIAQTILSPPPWIQRLFATAPSVLKAQALALFVVTILTASVGLVKLQLLFVRGSSLFPVPKEESVASTAP